MVGIQNIIRNFEGEELIVSRYSTFIRWDERGVQQSIKYYTWQNLEEQS